jgi:hypothetical protein
VEPVPSPDDPTADAAPPGQPGASNNQDPAPGADKHKPQRDRPAERRIAKLSKQLDDAKSEGQADKVRITQLEHDLQELKTTVEAKPPPAEPQLVDFPDPKAYAEAYAGWKTEVAASKPKPKATPAAPAKPPVELKDRPGQDPAIQAWQEAGTEAHGDRFDEALDRKGTAVNQMMGEFLEFSEHGHAIYIHLAENQAESKEIFRYGPAKTERAMKALEKKAAAGELIEGELQVADPPDPGKPDKDPKATPKAAAPAKTKAPEPPSSTKDGAAVNLTADPENESMDDYAARRQKEEARKAGHIVN